MKRSPSVLAAVCLLTTVLAGEPPRQAEAKPPWPGALQGQARERANRDEKQLAALQQAGRFAEALRLAQGLAALRSKEQGNHHWETIDARMKAEALRRVLEQPSERQKEYGQLPRLEKRVAGLEKEGRYRQAQPFQERILAICRQVLGEDHPDTATSYNNLAANQNGQGKYREAEEGFRKALAIRRKVLGEEHPATALSHSNLAANQNDQGKYREAEEGFRKALAIRRKLLGEEHLSTAASYNNLAANQNAQGSYREAEEGLRKALAIHLKILGEEHPATALSYNDLAGNQDAQGKYGEAEEGHRKALTIYLKVFGEEYPDTALIYDSLAANQNAQGKYREAEQGYRKALAIRRKLLGEEHPDTATSYNNLALNQSGQGKYREAEEGLRKALAIRRKVLGEAHPATAGSYNNLATIQNAQGKYREADERYQKALAIFRKILGEEHPYTATSYNNLAHNQNAQGKYREAEEGFRKALAIRRQVLGEEQPATALSYNNLAFNQHAQGKYREAEEGFRKALAIRRKLLGEEHPDTALIYDNLAANQSAQGKYREGEEGYRKALAIRRKLLGEEHPDTGLSYSSLAYNQNAQGRYREAQVLWKKAAGAFGHARLSIAATGLERAAFGSQLSPLLALAGVLARQGETVAAWQQYEASLGRGTWDDLATRLRIPPTDRDRQQSLTFQIARLNQRLTRLVPAASQQREELLTQLRQHYDALDTLNHELQRKYGPGVGEVYGHKRLQHALPADTALVGWVDMEAPRTAADPNGEHWAFVLCPSGPPLCIRLTGQGNRGAWTNADSRLPFRLREALRTTSDEWQPLARRMYRQRLAPVAAALHRIHHLVILPSTALAGVPVEVFADRYTISYAHSGTLYAFLRQQPRPNSQGLLALGDPAFQAPTTQAAPLPPGGVLLLSVLPGSNAARAGLKANDVLLRYGDVDLAGPADLKRALQQSILPGQRVAVALWRDGRRRAWPLYVDAGPLGVVPAPDPAPQALAAERDWQTASLSRGEKLAPLPGTRFEVAALAQLFAGQPTVVLLGSHANEQRLDELARTGALGRYRYLHLATHGRMDDSQPLASTVFVARDHLPGARERLHLLETGAPIPDGELTAEKILQRWHLYAELVTLSACQTALGKYESGEGYVGFAQALILAGSRSVCLSLWKVDDTATALLMQRFYQNLLGKRPGLTRPMPKAEALQEAKAWLRQLSRREALALVGRLFGSVPRGKDQVVPHPAGHRLPSVPGHLAKAAHPFAHPHYWAAFILTGHTE